MVGPWIEKQTKAVIELSFNLEKALEEQLANLKQYETVVTAYRPHMDELEACNQAVQEAMIFENPHTDYTMEVCLANNYRILPSIVPPFWWVKKVRNRGVGF